MKFDLTREFSKKESKWFCGCSIEGCPSYAFEDHSQHRKNENVVLFQTEYVCYRYKRYMIEKWQKIENHD